MVHCALNLFLEGKLGRLVLTCMIFVFLALSNTLSLDFCFHTGIASLGAQFAKLRKGLKHLNFAKTSLSPKGKTHDLTTSASAAQAQKWSRSSLRHCAIAGPLVFDLCYNYTRYKCYCQTCV